MDRDYRLAARWAQDNIHTTRHTVKQRRPSLWFSMQDCCNSWKVLQVHLLLNLASPTTSLFCTSPQ